MGFVRAKWGARGVPNVSGTLVRPWRLLGRFRRGYIIVVAIYVQNVLIFIVVSTHSSLFMSVGLM